MTSSVAAPGACGLTTNTSNVGRSPRTSPWTNPGSGSPDQRGYVELTTSSRGLRGSASGVVISTALGAHGLVGQGGDLFRDQPDEEDDHRRTVEQHAHVGEAMVRRIRVTVIARGCQEE